MNIRLRLSVRMLFFIISITSLAFYTTLSIISNHLQKDAYAETMKLNESQAKKYTSIIKATIESDFDKIRILKQITEDNSDLSYDDKRSLYDAGLKKLVEKNNHFLAVWDSWELQFIDTSWNLPHGRVTRSFYRDINNNINLKVDSLDLEGDDYESLYYFYKLVPESAITDPYTFSYTGRKKDEILESSIIIPLEINNQFGGLVGIDFNLEYFQTFVDSINNEQSYSVVFFSYNGDIIAHQDKSLIGENIVVVDTFLTRRFNILDRIQSDSTTNFVLKDKFGNDSSYLTLSSFTIGDTHTPWALLISAPLQKIENQFAERYEVLRNSAIIGLIILSIVILLFSLSIIRPIIKTRSILNKLAVGDVHKIDKLKIKSNDELGEMANSVNTVADGLNEVTQFAENIGSGNYDYEFKQLSDNDTLGLAIIEMRNSLKKARAEERIRQEEARQLEWASKGMNIFNKVLRVDNRDLENLTYEIIKTLTTYLDSHMGGIYVRSDINENDFELISFIGFSKNKYEKKFVRGEDGIIGQCILEQETVFINDVPQNYETVGSGLGNSIPRSILVVPLLSNRVLIGILEIESLGSIQEYHIKFVERIAETIAATVSTVKTNARTAQLLNNSQKQAEELEQQEEEMRQNMEEMQATQEEASKREVELGSFIEGFNNLIPVIEYDIKGKVIDVNDNYLKIYKSKKSQVVGKHHKADLFMNETDKAKHNEFWNELGSGEEQESLEYIRSGKDDYWYIEKFMPIKDQYGLVQKVLCIGFDITEQHQTESKIRQVKEGVIKTDTKKQKPISNNPAIDLDIKYEVIDLTYLKMVYKKDSGKIYNILKLYYETLPSQINEIEVLAKDRDFTKLKSRINSLKTKMSYLGLKKVYEQLREIEKLLSTNKNLAEIPDMINAVMEFWSVAYNELRTILVLSDVKK